MQTPPSERPCSSVRLKALAATVSLADDLMQQVRDLGRYPGLFHLMAMH